MRKKKHGPFSYSSVVITFNTAKDMSDTHQRIDALTHVWR